MAVRVVNPEAFAQIHKGVDRIATVSDDEIAEAVADGWSLGEYDNRVEIVDLEKRRLELLDEIAEAEADVATEQTEVDALETLSRLKTDVEQELMDKGIITMAKAIESDYTPAVAEELNGNPANCEEKKENTWPE